MTHPAIQGPPSSHESLVSNKDPPNTEKSFIYCSRSNPSYLKQKKYYTSTTVPVAQFEEILWTQLALANIIPPTDPPGSCLA